MKLHAHSTPTILLLLVTGALILGACAGPQGGAGVDSQATAQVLAETIAAATRVREAEVGTATAVAATAAALQDQPGDADTPTSVPETPTQPPQETDAPPPTATLAPTPTPTSPPPTNTPAPAPTNTPPPAPTPTKVRIAQSDVDGDDGNDFLRGSSDSNNGRVILIPGFDQFEIGDPPVFRDRIVFRVEVFDTRAGLYDGAGIRDVTFRIRDENSGDIVHERTERMAGYCVFGGGEPDCNVLGLNAGSQWPSTDREIRNGDYVAEIDIVPVDGQATQWRWRFQIASPGLAGGAPPAPGLSARINAITIQGDRYAVDFQTFGFEPLVPGQHVHFFWNTVPPDQAGTPGSGPWQLYPTGPGQPNTSPFTMYGLQARPSGATQICILVANPDHSVIQGTGNCVDLPS